MGAGKTEEGHHLADHFFRTEYGKLVSVITRYLGTDQVETAEDIVQETLLKAVDYWQHHGIPKNPQAWLYTTARNLTLNLHRRSKHQQAFTRQTQATREELQPEFPLPPSETGFADEQLTMMFVCCHPSLSADAQIALTLKILCGFSIAEIASAFFCPPDTINKRLVRGRKHLRTQQIRFELPPSIAERLPIVLQTIYLLFNEGYSPSRKNQVIRYDLCHEAIRLAEMLAPSPLIEAKGELHALLALMYLNAARFTARMNHSHTLIEMEQQDRSQWDQKLINTGIHSLNQAMAAQQVSPFLILATISAHHCIAPTYAATNWTDILALYDSYLLLADSPITRLNRSVAVAKVKGNPAAIEEVLALESASALAKNHRYFTTLGTFYQWNNELKKAASQFKKAISLAPTERDRELLSQKLAACVPV